MRSVYIVRAVRTAGGRFGGSLKNITVPQLGAVAIREVLRRAGVSGESLDEVIFGSAWQAGVGPNPARLASVEAGVPVTVPAVSVNVRCGSSLKALIMGAHAIMAGEEHAIVAGGAESTSNVPYLLKQARWGYRMGNSDFVDALHQDGFYCPLAEGLMGQITEQLVTQYSIAREEQDTYACVTQQRAFDAVRSGAFAKEIAGVKLVDRKTKTTTIFEQDEVPREGTTVEKLERLAPVFEEHGTITAGNSSALCDAASALVLMSEEKVNELGLTPMAEIAAMSFVGVNPREFGMGPVPATRQALKKAGLSLRDIDLIELNEAFAAQVIACDRELRLDRNKLNVNGGAIALGHPIAATGGKILTTLLHALESRGKELGLCTLCVSAPSEAWCALQGESPCRVRVSHPPVSSVASLAEPGF